MDDLFGTHRLTIAGIVLFVATGIYGAIRSRTS
jgi:hypothetical protein